MNHAGAAYVYTKVSTVWTLQATLTDPVPADFDQFGISTAITSDGNMVLIGANSADTSGKTDAGKVLVFTRSGSTWTYQTTLTASDGLADDSFGVSVATSIDASVAAIGASGADDGGKNISGKAYLFTRSGSTWTQAQILNASDASANDSFGASASLSSELSAYRRARRGWRKRHIQCRCIVPVHQIWYLDPTNEVCLFFLTRWK